MSANTAPIFSKKANIGFPATIPITAAANTYTGAGANDVLCFTADATNGSYIRKIRFKAAGTNVASVARIYINNGSSNGTAANNCFFGEISLPATTAVAAAATVDIDYPMEIAIPAGYKIYIGLGTAVSAGWIPCVIAGDY